MSGSAVASRNANPEISTTNGTMGAVGLNVTDTFYAKNNPIYLNVEN